ncbi:2-hydroxy-3-oxopropionate reductase [Jannaschia seosinensis]|uniref:2-hydroxy-3-oxopropionate reductase n=1 Tax=Jannaschia seosinensis TaxID=313367 RepID=A0A0M7B7Q1_9RHOB|nr:NAD(P)-dependent oxidoreductase [Jannaschia seosinensis]CUH25690.1 2-hydroxy-3-oxopropionate reductase [Jannaschia seosinensis]
MPDAKIGFIGLGLMGSAMAQRLLDCGHTLMVLGNRNRTGLDASIARGATEAGSAREVAEACDVVMLCMGTSDHVEARMRGDGGVIEGLRPDAVVIDFGTSLPGSTKALGADVEAAGGTYLDAPLGRTPSHAREGKLNIMAAGDRAAFDRVRPLLDDLGENVFHLGELGSGHTIKLINNFFAMTTANAMAEAFAMADRAGVARDKLHAVMAAGPLHSGMMDFIANYAKEGQVDLAFSVANARKDVSYYKMMADELEADSIMSICALMALSTAVEAGRGDAMVPEMVDFFADRFSSEAD